MDSTNIINTVNGILDALTKKFGVAADKIYPILMKQTQVDLLQNILIMILSAIAIGISIMLIRWEVKKVKSKEIDIMSGTVTAISIVAVALFIIGVAHIIIDVGNCTQILINPNYYIFSNYIQPLIKQ